MSGGFLLSDPACRCDASTVNDAAVDADAFNAFEEAGWERRAAGYDHFFGPVTAQFAGPLLDATAVGRGTRVLDVACGPGYVSEQAVARGASVTGVDIAAAMISIAGTRVPQADFRRASAEELPVTDGSFDAVVASLVILHLGRPEQAVSEFARVLVPGGRVALTVWDTPERSPLPGVLFEAIAASGAQPPADLPVGPPFYRFSDEQEFRRVLGGAGLENATVATLSFSYRAASADELWAGLLGGTVRAGGLIERQPEEIRERIHAELERIVDEYRDGEAVELPISVKLASARKPRERKQ